MRLQRTYKDAINALNSLQSNFALLEAIRRAGPLVNKNELSIKEVYEYVRRLGYQPADFNRLNVIHVTGTKGKGSTCAFAELILRQYRGPAVKEGGISKIGLFTSPHLKTVRERIRINGSPINEAKFTKYFFDVWDRLLTTELSTVDFPTLQPSATVKPMYFKYLTILSFHVFLQEGVDTAIYEVGVGGTYDSTNIVPRPTVTGIASMGIDHTFMLGNTIEQITWNKTGIFKKDVPAVVSVQQEYPEAQKTIEARAQELQTASLEVVGPDTLSGDVELGLAGDFQRQNAALAVRLAAVHLEALGVPRAELPDPEDPSSLPEKFLVGLRDAKWDGRCQIIRGKPDGVTWHLDGAHTLELMKVAAQWFQQTVLAAPKTARSGVKVLLFNQQNRENASELLTRLYTSVTSSQVKFDHVIFTTNVTWSDGHYSSDLVLKASSEDAVSKLEVQKQLAETWNKLDQAQGFSSRKHIFPDIETGVNFIRSLAADGTEVSAFVCGSLHLVGGFLVVLDGEKE